MQIQSQIFFDMFLSQINYIQSQVEILVNNQFSNTIHLFHDGVDIVLDEVIHGLLLDE